ncbi:hypothetical protein [Streptomyces sp. bgisy032]|uniref:hypothetical protein n=1 Tax=Streptomyces sp. bgisy032 TaxID=3413773 RepID=UPI003D7424D7
MPENIDTPNDDQPGSEVTDDTAAVDVSAADQSADTDAEPAGADALGDPGKRALDSMKSKWHEERDRRRALEEQLEALKAPKPSSDSGQPDPEEIRAQARAEVRRDLGIQLEAKGRLANPEDVQRYAEYFKDVKADDPASIRAAVDELLEDRPYLAATGRPRFQGSGDGGAARKASGPSQLTRDDLKNMSPEAIVKAKREGRLKDVLAGG